MMKVLVACEYSGIVRDAFASKGHDAWSCDLLQTELPGNHIQGDVLEILNEEWDLMIAHPPCTYLANSGLHYLKGNVDRQKMHEAAVNFVVKIWQTKNCKRLCIENPTGWLNTNWRKPNQIIQPYYFGDKEQKTTCLWLRGLPKLQGLVDVAMDIEAHKPKPTKTIIRKSGVKAGQPYNYYWRQGKTAHDISKTFSGIAKAMAEQWG